MGFASSGGLVGSTPANPSGRDGSRVFSTEYSREKLESLHLRFTIEVQDSRESPSQQRAGREDTYKPIEPRQVPCCRKAVPSSFVPPNLRRGASSVGADHAKGGGAPALERGLLNFLKKFGAQVQPEGEPLKERFGMSTQPHGTSLWSAPDVGCGLKVSAMVN
jgi:hypothetical protein